MMQKIFLSAAVMFACVAAGLMTMPQAAVAANNAQFVSQSVPATMVAGQTYSVSVKMKNNGTTAWTAASAYRLGSQSPQDNGTWGFNRVYLVSGENVAVGATKTFAFSVKAPATPGTYYFQWQMLREFVQWFGAKSTKVKVTVTAASCANDCATSGLAQCSGTGYQTCGNYDSDSCLEWSGVTACAAGKSCTGGTCSASAVTHQMMTQYWAWLGGGSGGTTTGWDGVDYGTPTVGAKYYSGDPVVAEKHLQQMKAAGINVVSYGWLNQKQEGPVWLDVNPDDAFQKGMMQAPSFKDMKFNISYDLGSRIWLVGLAEQGIHPTPGTKIDRIPGIDFNDPKLSADSPAASDDFSLMSNGKYIYDELLSYDFDYLARTYLNQPNYQKIGGKAVVFLYDTARFNNGKDNADLVNGFARALLRVRNEVYSKYGITLYLVGDFAKYHTTYWSVAPAGDSRILSKPQDYKDWGYLQNYDAVGSWNNFQGLSYESLSAYTDTAKDINTKWQAVTFSTNRTYRQYLTGSVKAAYGSENIRLDYIPALVYSFWTPSSNSFTRNLWSQATDTSEVTKQTNMVKQFRDSSVCAEESTDMVYQVAWNQWGEGQIIESSIEDNTAPYPGKYGTRYLDSIRDILTGGPTQVCTPNAVSGCKVCNSGGTGWVDTNSRCLSSQTCQSGVCVAVTKKANGAQCGAASECTSGYCKNTYCVPSGTYCGGVEAPYYFASGEYANNQWFFGVCRSGNWKTVSGGIGCDPAGLNFACDSSTSVCTSNACVTSGNNRANGADCTASSQCSSGICNNSYCVPSASYCGGMESPMYFSSGNTASNAWASGVCRNDIWKIVTGGIGCNLFACDSSTAVCVNNKCQ